MNKPSKRHQWDKENSLTLDDHSKAKHRILSDYIQQYLAIVCQSRKIRKFKLTLVDGFAGGGVYKDNQLGSPWVMINAVTQAIFNINKDRKEQVVIEPHYFFIEKNVDNFNALKRTGVEEQHGMIKLVHGDFNTYLSQIIDHIKKRNPQDGGGAIFFLDQEGYTDVDIPALNTMRKVLPKAEVIINISISRLIDFISIENPNQFKQTISNMGLSRFIDVNEIIRLKANIKDNRNIIEAKLSVAFQKASGFPYFRPFFIQPENNHRGYWLLHLAPHYRAHNAMSDVIWKHGNYMRHYGGGGTRILDLFYKGGIHDDPDIFGSTFNETAKKFHMDGLVRDLPKEIWKQEAITVSDLIKSTCNITAANEVMYKESLITMRNEGEIEICGKSGGKKRSDTISPDDIITPNKQGRIIFPSSNSDS